MTSVSYADLFGLPQEASPPEDIRPGDTVRTGPNPHPRYTVVAIDGDKAWLRNPETGLDGIVEARRCRKL